MNSGFDYRFYVAIIGAALFKLLTSPWHSPTRAVLTVCAAVFAAWVFTDPVLHFMSWPPDSYRNPVAALLALTGESFMRWAITATPEKIGEMLRRLRS